MDTRRHNSGELDLLTKRRDLLERLCDGPVPKSTLFDELDLSRSTLDRAVRELESLDLVERRESGIRATVSGRLAADALETCQSTLVDIHAAEAVVEPLALDAPLQRETVVGSDATLATEPAPYEALEPFHDAVAAAEGYRACFPALDDPRQLRLLYEHVVTDGLPAELVVTPGLFDALREQFSRRMAAMADCDGFELLLSEELPPFALGLVDGTDGVTVSVVVFAESGAVHGTLINRTAVGVQWGRSLFEKIEAGAIERTDELRDGGDGSPAGGADRLTPGTLSLPLALVTEGFVRPDRSYFREHPVAEPTTAWRADLSLPEVHTGYAVDRAAETDDTAGGAGQQAVHEALVAELVDGKDCVLLGPPGSGKSTVCKQVACDWYDADRGPVLYREQGRGRPFASVEALLGTVDAGDGHALVVVEDAVRPEADAIFDAVKRLSDRDDVSFLLDAREREWRDLTGDPPSAAGLSVTHMPTLDDSDVERLVTHFERTVDRSVDVPVDRLRRDVRDETATDDETSPDELLLVLHRLATYADPLADGLTSLEEAVAAHYDGLVSVDRNSRESTDVPAGVPEDSSTGGLALDVCVLGNVLNAAGIGVERGLLYALADDGEFDAVDDAVDRLEGRVLFPRGDGTYRTVHEAWSAAFLAHLLDAEGETAAAERFCRCVSRLLALADDREKCEAIARHLNSGSALAAIRDDPERWADETVEAVYVMGRERPKLAPLFGDGRDHGITVPDACSADTGVERSVWLGQLFLAAGYYDQAERTFERLPDDEPDVAIERLLGLADVGIQRGECEAAKSRAEECLSLVDDGRPNDSARAALKLGHALQQLGDYGAASEQFRAAIDGFEAVDDRRRLAQALNGLGRLVHHQGKTDQARSYHERSLDLAREIGDRKGQARSLNELGQVAMEAGEYREALTHHEHGLDIRGALGDRHGEAKALNNIGMVYNMLGNYDQALEYGERSLAIKRDLGDRLGEANTCSTLGIVAASNGDHERAREYFEQSARIKRELGNRLGEAMVLGNLGNVACRQCEYEAAREYSERALAMIRDLGAGGKSVESCINLGEVARRRGRYDRAREFLEEAREIARDTDDQHRHAQSLDRLVAVARRRGDHDRARDLLDRAREMADDVGDPGLLSKTRSRQAELARESGEYDRAREALARAEDAVDEGGDQLDVARVRLARARVAVETGDRESAREYARDAREIYAELSSPHFEARSRRVLGRVAAESGDWDDAREQFEAALDTFEAVGAPQDALLTLKRIVEGARNADDTLQQWLDRVEEVVAAAPDPAVESHREWIDEHLDVATRKVEQD
jgi:tetratricopeptide (TPR) repeat protein/predicted transcriptional regulator